LSLWPTNSFEASGSEVDGDRSRTDAAARQPPGNRGIDRDGGGDVGVAARHIAHLAAHDAASEQGGRLPGSTLKAAS
jgi:hypothetical protein